MKSVIPRFSKNTPEEAVVLKKKDTSALSSPRNVGKWRYEVSVLKEAEFQKESIYKENNSPHHPQAFIKVIIHPLTCSHVRILNPQKNHYLDIHLMATCSEELPQEGLYG